MKKALKNVGANKDSFLVELSETFKAGVPFCEAKIDKEKNIIKDICLLTLESKNGRVYLPQAIENAVELFEGVKTFANHPRKSERGEVRDVRDLIGKCLNPHYREGKLRADLLILESHKGWVFPLAAQAPDLVGLSINAQGKVRRINGKDVVEEIVEVQSVDLVSEPAATQGLFEEFLQDEELRFFQDLTVEKIRQYRNDLIDEIQKEKDALIAQLKDEIQSLKEELNSYKEREKLWQKKEIMEGLLKESDLKLDQISEVFKNTLLSLKANDLTELEENMRKLITDREDMVMKNSGLIKGMGQEKDNRKSSTILNDDIFVNVIKGGKY